MSGHHTHETESAPATGPRFCERSCPLGIPVHALCTLHDAGRYNEAMRLLLSRSPFPGTAARLCSRPCEKGCPLSEQGRAPAVRELERFLADHAQHSCVTPLPCSGKRVAVVGAGPAGLSAARFASLLGHSVDIYERGPLAGGIPRLAVPAFRLPRHIIDREAATAFEGDVRFFPNVAVGRDLMLADLLERYDACILAVGLWTERMLTMPGSEHFQPAFAWLCRMALEPETLAGRDVAVLGGSDVAFDCARTAVRLNARSVQLICLESEAALLSAREDASLAKAEGVQIHASIIGRSVVEDHGRLRLDAEKVLSFRFNEYCQLCVELAENSACSFEADLFFCSNGLVFEETVLSGVEVERNSRGRILTDEDGRTSIPHLFAAGDMAAGPTRAVSAMAFGRRAAEAVHQFLTGQPAPQFIPETDTSAASAPFFRERLPASVPFAEARASLSSEQAAREAAACLSCTDCTAQPSEI